MEKGATCESIKQDACQCKGVKMICSDEIVCALLFEILQTLAIAVYGDDEIDEIGDRIDRLADELIHIRILAEKLINICFGVVFFPDDMTVENIVEDRDECGKEYSGHYRHQYTLSVRFPE